VYELIRRSENLARQPASPSLYEPRSDGTVLVETSKLGRQNEISWHASPSCNNQALLNSTADHSRALATEDLLYQNTAFEWEPDAGCVIELEGFNIGTYSHFNSSGNDFSFDWFSSGPLPSLSIESTFSTPADCMFHTPYLVLRPMDYDYSIQSTSLISPQSPFIRTRLSNGSQIGRTFLMQSVQSYATLLATSALPLFIHPISLPTQGPSPLSATPLEICKSIISLYVNKTAATSLFIWRAITMEKDRFLEEIEDADEWTTLSMLQAITVYTLLRICDQSPFSVTFDHELVHTMIVRYFNQRSDEASKYNINFAENCEQSPATSTSLPCWPRLEGMGVFRIKAKVVLHFPPLPELLFLIRGQDGDATLYYLSAI
jgi:hypothetical protein